MALQCSFNQQQTCRLLKNRGPKGIRAFASKPGRSRVRSFRVVADAAATPASTAPSVPLEQSGKDFKAALDIEAIKKVLPHRYPFLLVDRVIEVQREKYAIGYKNVTVNDQFFNGHFPERSIMPGVLQVEALAQLGGMAMLDPEDEEGKQLFFFGGVENCRFRKPVVPGDTFMMKVEVTKFNKKFGIVKLTGKGYVGETLAIEADLTLAMGKPAK